MDLQINNLGDNKNILIEQAIEEVILYFDTGEFTDKNLVINLVKNEDEDDMRADEYLSSSFAIWKELYARYPEFLIFSTPSNFMEILFCYKLFTKANSGELMIFSAQKALEKGIDSNIVDNRIKELEKLLI